MQAQIDILGAQHKQMDFFYRIMDMMILGGGLLIAHLIFDVEWRQSSTLLLLFGIVFYQLSASHTGIHSQQRNVSLNRQLQLGFMAVTGTFVLLAMVSNLSDRLHSIADRLFLTVWYGIEVVALSLWTVLVRKLLVYSRQLGFNRRSAAIVGAGVLGRSLADKFQLHTWMGIDPKAFYDDQACQEDITGIPCAGDIDKLIADAKAGHFDRVYITLPLSKESVIRRIVDELSDSTINLYLVPDVFAFDLLNARQTSIDGLPAISIYDSPFTFTDSVLKRGFDIFGSLGILAVIAIPMIAIAMAVKLTSKGPAIFKQKRYGLDGKPIEVWKFRSMTTQDNGSVVVQATKNDARLTPIGSFIRRTSLDELPQFINVLQGQMSIVGPRPHAIAHNEEYRRLIKGYMLRHKVKPGITGWAQINGWRGETDTLEKMENRIKYDLEYIKNWSLWLDVKIVFLTVFKGFIGKNAY
ncbi:MAG TPA: undecaprenyl-phosphate glucose phosphotransferase [Fluviicoccus sp.]|nr:undecaprenyl-phosphate glucose phosphotransferase [Fluviicoccus sp.]